MERRGLSPQRAFAIADDLIQRFGVARVTSLIIALTQSTFPKTRDGVRVAFTSQRKAQYISLSVERLLSEAHSLKHHLGPPLPLINGWGRGVIGLGKELSGEAKRFRLRP